MRSGAVGCGRYRVLRPLRGTAGDSYGFAPGAPYACRRGPRSGFALGGINGGEGGWGVLLGGVERVRCGLVIDLSEGL